MIQNKNTPHKKTGYDFEDLKKMIDEYSIKRDDKGKWIVEERGTGKKITDPKMVTKAAFALHWHSAGGISRESIPAEANQSGGFTRGWNSSAEDIYKDLKGSFLAAHVKAQGGSIQWHDVRQTVEKGRAASYKYGSQIVNNLFGSTKINEYAFLHVDENGNQIFPNGYNDQDVVHMVQNFYADMINAELGYEAYIGTQQNDGQTLGQKVKGKALGFAGYVKNVMQKAGERLQIL